MNKAYQDYITKYQGFVRKDATDIANGAYSQQTQDQAYGVATTSAHQHTGTDSLPVDYLDLTNKTRYIIERLLGPTTATSTITVPGDFVMPFSGYFVSIGATVDTAGTTGNMTIALNVNGAPISVITIATGSTTSRPSNPFINPTAFTIGDVITFTVLTVQTTPAQGLSPFMLVVQTKP